MSEMNSFPLQQFEQRSKTLRWYLRCAKEQLMMRALPQGSASLSQLKQLRNSQRGKRCFILGNGPSLRQTDLSKLRGEFTFGLNRIYLLFPEMGFNTTYLVAVNKLVIEQFGKDILALPTPRFIPWSYRDWLPKDITPPIFLNLSCGKPGFSTDCRRPVWIGATVTYVALQLAYHIGFEQVILVGVDHSFVTQGQPNKEIVSTGADPNHFHPDYFGKGHKWQLPDLETSEIAYRMAREAFEQDGRKVLDATIGGKLTVFPKADYNTLF